MLEGKISGDSFLQKMITPFAQEGIGLTRSAGGMMTQKMKKMLEESRDVMRLRKMREANAPASYQRAFVRRLRAHLLDVYTGQVTPLQMKRFDEIIADRVYGITRKEDFQALLNLPLAKGGVGFGARTARAMTLYLEKLLAQGVPVAHEHEQEAL